MKPFVLCVVLMISIASCGSSGPTVDAGQNPASSSATSTAQSSSTSTSPSTSEATPTSEPASDELLELLSGQTVEVGVGDTVEVPWASLTVEIVAFEDSRCPPDAECVWEGEFAVELRFVTEEGKSVDRRLVGVLDQGFTFYGDQPSTRLENVEVTTTGVSDDGHLASLLFVDVG